MKQFDTCNVSDKSYFTRHQPSTESFAKLLMTLCWQVREQLETPQGVLLFIFILCLIKKDPLSNCKAFCVIPGKCLTNSVDKDSHYYLESTDFPPSSSFPLRGLMHYSSPITWPRLICQPGASVSYLCGGWADTATVIKWFCAMTSCLSLFPLLQERPDTNWLSRTDQVGEVHIQPFAVAKVRVHPTAVQDHLRDAFFQNLVILRPKGSEDVKRNNQTRRGERYEWHKLCKAN